MKIARWYYSTKTETPLKCAKNGNKVPKSAGAMPAMDLPEDLWDDLDFGWYMGEAQKKLNVLFTGDEKFTREQMEQARKELGFA